MKLGVLFSGGKDSTYAAYLADRYSHKIAVLISIISQNPDSYMFHTPAISKVEKQAEVMEIPLISTETKGEKEKELEDLEKAINRAKKEYNIEGIVTGAVESVYQASRVQKICKKLGLYCFNPLWQKDQIELLRDLLKANFKTIITGVSAYPLDEKWLERPLNKKFIEDIKILNEKYKLNPSGEGGEYETFVLNCPLYSKPLRIKDKKIQGKKHSWNMEIDVE